MKISSTSLLLLSASLANATLLCGNDGKYVTVNIDKQPLTLENVKEALKESKCEIKNLKFHKLSLQEARTIHSGLLDQLSVNRRISLVNRLHYLGINPFKYEKSKSGAVLREALLSLQDEPVHIIGEDIADDIYQLTSKSLRRNLHPTIQLINQKFKYTLDNIREVFGLSRFGDDTTEEGGLIDEILNAVSSNQLFSNLIQDNCPDILSKNERVNQFVDDYFKHISNIYKGSLKSKRFGSKEEGKEVAKKKKVEKKESSPQLNIGDLMSNGTSSPTSSDNNGIHNQVVKLEAVILDDKINSALEKNEKPEAIPTKCQRNNANVHNGELKMEMKKSPFAHSNEKKLETATLKDIHANVSSDASSTDSEEYEQMINDNKVIDQESRIIIKEVSNNDGKKEKKKNQWDSWEKTTMNSPEFKNIGKKKDVVPPTINSNEKPSSKNINSVIKISGHGDSGSRNNSRGSSNVTFVVNKSDEKKNSRHQVENKKGRFY